MNGDSNSTASTPKIDFCPNTTRTVDVSLNLNKQPLDVYVLMDFSGSMSVHKNRMFNVSNELITKLQEISPDVQIGFGVICDKPYPMGPGSSIDYSYKNTLPLTKDMDSFPRAVASEMIRSGGDFEESQLDGMYQAAECTAQVGWRDNAIHLMMLITDADFHVAGDGTVSKF